MNEPTEICEEVGPTEEICEECPVADWVAPATEWVYTAFEGSEIYRSPCCAKHGQLLYCQIRDAGGFAVRAARGDVRRFAVFCEYIMSGNRDPLHHVLFAAGVTVDG